MKWKKSKILYLALVSVISFLYSCENVNLEPEKVGSVSFANDIKPIFSNNCIACHGGSLLPDLRPDAAYNSLKNGGYFDLTTPAESKIIKKLNLSSHSARASDVEKQKILQWIIQGAKND